MRRVYEEWRFDGTKEKNRSFYTSTMIRPRKRMTKEANNISVVITESDGSLAKTRKGNAPQSRTKSKERRNFGFFLGRRFEDGPLDPN
jgi:hypothetical protein